MKGIISQRLQVSNFNSKLEKCKEFEKKVNFDLQEGTMETRCSKKATVSNLTATWPWFGGWGLCGSCEEDREEKSFLCSREGG